MDIREYFRILRRWWPIIPIATILGVGLGYATMFPLVNKWLPDMFSTEYKSAATLFVATQNGTTVSEAYQNSQFSMDRVNSYAGLANSEQVASRAVDELKAPISSGELRSKISAEPVPKTVLLSVGVHDPDPGQAQIYANAVADQLVGLVSELETSRRGGTPAAGAIVVDEADYPTETMGLALWKRLALGGAVGLLLGIVIAVLVGVLDRRLRGREGVEELTDSPVLGGLPDDPLRRKADVVDLAGDGLYAERIRALRTSLRFTVPPQSDGPARVIVVASPSARDGRTTVAIDLAAALAESGKSVVLVDGDLRNSALADRLSLDDAMREGAANRGLSTVLVGENDVAEVVIAQVPTGNHTITLLPAGPTAPRPGELWASDRATVLFDTLAANFDYVVVDTPPLDAYTDGAIAAALADGALVLARVKHTTTAALRRGLQVLQSANAEVVGTVVTFEPIAPAQRWNQRKQVTAAISRSAKSGEDAHAERADSAGRASTGNGRDSLVAAGDARHASRTRRGSS